jgi:hypothetical protein
MTYGRVRVANYKYGVHGAVVSHSAELVRGDLVLRDRRPPHPPIVPEARLRHDGHLLPKGRRKEARPPRKWSRVQ